MRKKGPSSSANGLRALMEEKNLMENNGNGHGNHQKKDRTVAQQRNYRVLDVRAAKEIALLWLQAAQLENVVVFGLPEVDDRYHIWRVPLLHHISHERIGEVVVDAHTSLILEDKSTAPANLEARLLGRQEILESTGTEAKNASSRNGSYKLSTLRNTIAYGDCEEILQDLPAESVDLVFTSPPYYNARPEYTDYVTYEEYLLKLRKIIQNVHRVLAEGRFFVINISPVLVRRANRSEASKRIAVPFDIHRIFIEEEYDFIDDIIWVKPEGAGWATGRGRRFAADRNPLQYKPVPVTEYILVYRKRTTKLIDWNIRAHPNPELVEHRASGMTTNTPISGISSPPTTNATLPSSPSSWPKKSSPTTPSKTTSSSTHSPV